MITSRLEQALQVRDMEAQLSALTKRVARLEQEAITGSVSNAWPGYLLSLLTAGPLPREQAVRAINLWFSLRLANGGLPPPHAVPLEDGTFSMAWDNGNHHFEIELLPTGLYDWFYRDRLTARIEGEQDLPIGSLPDAMIELLDLIHYRS